MFSKYGKVRSSSSRRRDDLTTRYRRGVMSEREEEETSSCHLLCLSKLGIAFHSGRRRRSERERVGSLLCGSKKRRATNIGEEDGGWRETPQGKQHKTKKHRAGRKSVSSSTSSPPQNNKEKSKTFQKSLVGSSSNGVVLPLFKAWQCVLVLLVLSTVGEGTSIFRSPPASY